MKKTKIIYFLYLSALFIINGCVIYPTTHRYFEPSAVDGVTSDSTPCSHWSEEADQIKREFNKSAFLVSAYFREGKNLQVSVIIEPHGNDIHFNQELFVIIDSVTGRRFVPINNKVDSREDRIGTSVFRSELVYRHWISLTYDVDSDVLSDFDLVFSSEALHMNSEPLNISPVHFKRKDVKTIGYGSLNC